jgi:hypothetical protein
LAALIADSVLSAGRMTTAAPLAVKTALSTHGKTVALMIPGNCAPACRARSTLLSEMHGAYPRFHPSEIAAAEIALEMAIEEVEAEAAREPSSKLALPPRRTKTAKPVVLSQHFGVSSAEPVTAPRVAAKRYPAIPKTAPIGVNAVIPG